MIILSKIKYCFEQLLSEIYAVRSHKNNQQVCIDCLEPRLKKNKFECKNCGCSNFYEHVIKILHLKYSPLGDV